MTFDGTCERGGVQARAPQGIEERPPDGHGKHAAKPKPRGLKSKEVRFCAYTQRLLFLTTAIYCLASYFVCLLLLLLLSARGSLLFGGPKIASSPPFQAPKKCRAAEGRRGRPGPAKYARGRQRRSVRRAGQGKDAEVLSYGNGGGGAPGGVRQGPGKHRSTRVTPCLTFRW
jgi:hypothetical protein